MEVTIRHRFGTRREAICNLKAELRDLRMANVAMRKQVDAAVTREKAALLRIAELEHSRWHARLTALLLGVALILVLCFWLG